MITKPTYKKRTWSRPEDTIKQPTVLVALHNVISQFDEEMVRRYNERENPKKLITLDHRRGRDLENNFPKKIRDKFIEIREQVGFCMGVPLHEGVVQAFKEMRSLGIDVRICYYSLMESEASLSEVIRWIKTNFGPEWIDRILCTKDKTILRGNYLIDDDPVPHFSGEFTPEWEHIVFDKPYNRTDDLTTNKRLINWADWRSLGIMVGEEEDPVALLKTAPYFNHGSADSLDIDRFYVVPQMFSTKVFYDMCKGTHEDRNFLVISNGVVKDSFRGSSDENNNGLYLTYHLHTQHHPNPIQRLLSRDVPVKVLSTVRKIISRSAKHAEPQLSRRANLALKSRSFQERLDVMAALDYTSLLGMSVESRKAVAMQLGQTIALIGGTELFSKAEIKNVFQDLAPFINREDTSSPSMMAVLNKYRDIFLNTLHGVGYYQIGDLLLFHIPDFETIRKLLIPENFIQNFYQIQSRGRILHMILEKCLYFGFDHTFPRKNFGGWPEFFHPRLFLDYGSETLNKIFLIGIFSDEERNIYFSDGHGIYRSMEEMVTQIRKNIKSENSGNCENPGISENPGITENPEISENRISEIPKFNISGLDLENYYYVLQYREVEGLVLVGARSRLTAEFVTMEILEGMAVQAGLNIIKEK